MPNSCILKSYNLGIDNEMKTFPVQDLEKGEENVDNSPREGKILCY